MEQQLSVQVSSLYIKAALVYNVVQYSLRVQSAYHPKLCPFISEPIVFHTRQGAASLSFQIPYIVNLHECYVFLDFYLHQLLYDRARVIFKMQVQLQLDGEFMTQTADIYMQGRSDLKVPTKHIPEGARIISLPMLLCVPHNMQLKLSKFSFKTTCFVVQLKKYAIYIPVDAEQAISGATFLESDMCEGVGDFKTLEVFAISEVLGSELPMFNCQITFNMAKFTVSGSSVIIRAYLGRLKLESYILCALDVTTYVLAQQALERAEIRVSDVLDDAQCIYNNFKAMWHEWAPRLPFWQKCEAKAPVLEETLQKVLKILEKRKKIFGEYCTFDYEKNSSNAALTLLIQLVIYRNSAIIASNLYFLTEFQDVDNYGARAVILPLGIYSRRFGIINLDAGAAREPQLTELAADFGKNGYSIQLKNPDALAALLTELPTVGDFLYYSDITVTNELPELYASKENADAANTYRAHYVAPVIYQTLLKPATLTISLPEEYDSILVRNNRLQKLGISVSHELECYFVYCFLPFSQVLGQLSATSCTVRPLCAPELIDRHLYDVNAIQDGQLLLIYYLAGIQLNFAGATPESEDSVFRVETGVQAAINGENYYLSSGVIQPAEISKPYAFDSVNTSSSSANSWKKLIRADMIKMRDYVLFAKGSSEFRKACAAYTLRLQKEHEVWYFEKLREYALAQFRTHSQ